MTINATNITMRVGAGGVLEHISAIATWESLLTKTGPGTTDSSFNASTDITFLGSFRIPWITEDGGDANSTRDMHLFAYDSSTSSFFFGRHDKIGRFSIPALVVSDNIDDLNNSVKLQTINTYMDKIPNLSIDAGLKNDKAGWMKLIGGKLYISGYNYYDTTGQNDENIAICDDPYDFDTATWQGWITTGSGDVGASYVMDIPTDKKSAFDNKSYFMGTNAHLAIVTRSSLGHSLVGASLETIGSSDTSVSSTIYVRYTDPNYIYGFDTYNNAIKSYYRSLIGFDTWSWTDYFAVDPTINTADLSTSYPDGEVQWEDYLLLDPADRVSDLSVYDRPDLPIPTVLYGGWYPLGFIPEGSNSVVYLGKNVGSRYGNVYKSANLEHDGGIAGGPAAISGKDVDNVIFTMNLTDIANAVNIYDPAYSSVSVFDNNRWLQHSDTSGIVTGGTIIGGEYDRTSGKLYVVHSGMPDPATYNNGHVVSVYQIN